VATSGFTRKANSGGAIVTQVSETTQQSMDGQKTAQSKKPRKSQKAKKASTKGGNDIKHLRKEPAASERGTGQARRIAEAVSVAKKTDQVTDAQGKNQRKAKTGPATKQADP